MIIIIQIWLAMCSPCWFKFKNSDRFLFITHKIHKEIQRGCPFYKVVVHSTLVFWRFDYYWQPLLKTWRNRLKIKNNNRFLSNTRGIILLHSIFDVLIINGNLFWKRGRIDLLKLELFSIKNINVFDFKPILPRFQ